MVVRGAIWWVDLPEPTGSEPGYRRPILVVQSDDFNETKIRTVLAIGITSNLKMAMSPGNVMLHKKEEGLPKDSVANVSQLITIDRRFLKEYVGQLSQKAQRQIDDGLRKVLDL